MKKTKKLGQHFLIDFEIINKIVDAVSLSSGDVMIEIGPGLGALTYPISKILNKLVVIEYDGKLGIKLSKNIDNIQVFITNVLEFDFQKLINHVGKSIRVIGNLPYNISVPLLFYLFKFNNFIVDMNFMFQKEVANRLLAQPGTKNYSRLSVIAQYYCDISLHFDVPPESFFPIPKIISTFIQLKPHNFNNIFATNVNKLSSVTALAFCQRRKMIKNSLSSLFNSNIFKQLNIDPCSRAQDLSIQEYCLLSNYIN